MNKKRILTITFNDLSISYGPSVHYLELWNAFSELYKNECIIHGISPCWGNKQPIISPKFLLHTLKVPNTKLIRQVYYDFALAIKLFRYRKDIVYIRTSYFAFFVILIIKLFSIKPIIELNGIVKKDVESAKSPWWYKKIALWQEKFLIKNASACIAVSEGIEKHAKEMGAKKTITLLNGISPDFFNLPQHTQNGKLKVVYVGTYTAWDGAKYIPSLASNYPNVEFHMYGDGTLKKNIEKSSPPNVFFHGYVQYNKLKILYAEYDAGIVLYEKERNDMKLSSLKTLEYMASGLPIYTTNVPGQEYIENNNIGMNVPLEKMIELFQDFIDKIDFFKQNVAEYRVSVTNKVSWLSVAKGTRNTLFDI